MNGTVSVRLVHIDVTIIKVFLFKICVFGCLHGKLIRNRNRLDYIVGNSEFFFKTGPLKIIIIFKKALKNITDIQYSQSEERH